MRATRHIFWSHVSWLLTALLTACGGDSGGTAAQVQQTCTNLCNKNNECNKLNFNCSDFCNSSKNPASSAGGSTSSSNCDVNKLIAKENACISGSCTDFNSCIASATSVCSGTSSGTGGSNGTGASSSGTGGSTGSGGSSGSGASTSSGGSSSGAMDCSVCDQAASCCMAAGVGSSCATSFSKSSCDMESSSIKPMIIQDCQDAINGFKSAGLCK